MQIAKPLNGAQSGFNKLCVLGGGMKGGPARGKVQALLAEAGQRLNKIAYEETAANLAAYPDSNPWHVCYAVALGWGHLAQINTAFTGAVVRLMSDWNDADLRLAKRFCTERGPDVVEQSLRGGYIMFQDVRLPKGLPTTLKTCRDAQQRWLGRIINKARPPYIGTWNGTALFMVSLFANRPLADEMRTPEVLLPPAGAIHNGLSILHGAGVLSHPPAGTALDDDGFEPGAIYENNALFEELLKGHSAWNLLDVHSGIYMLGTRLPSSSEWFPV